MGLVSKRLATAAALVSASLFMVGGVPGTFHHLYFSGTPTSVMAIGAAFSALEVVPLIVLRSEEHTSELQSLMRISYAVFCLKKKRTIAQNNSFADRMIPRQSL